MNLKFVFRSAFLLVLAFSSRSYAYDLGLAFGKYEPHDGVVDGLFNTKMLATMARFAIPRDDGLAWSSFLFYYDFESKVANLENAARLWSLNSGFRKTFLEVDQSKTFGLEPFFGAGIGGVALFVTAEDELKEEKLGKQETYSYSYYWELGLNLTNIGVDYLDLEMKLTDLVIGKNLFGNINIGGRIVTVGVNYRVR